MNLLPRKILLFHLHAYQSLLWNRTVEKYLSDFKCKKFVYSQGEFLFPVVKLNNVEIPLIGFDYSCDEKVQKIVDEILDKEGLNERDFILKSLPRFSLTGDSRNLISEVKDLEVGELEEDDLNSGKKKLLVKFFLKKGCYATVYIKDIFSR